MNLTTKTSRRLHSLFRITEPQSWARVSEKIFSEIDDLLY